jgi:hypothetical protein
VLCTRPTSNVRKAKRIHEIFKAPADILITLASTMIGTLAKGATTNLIPRVLSGLQDSKPDTYYSKVKDIPTLIMDAFQKAMGVRELRMADSGGAWNMTDVVDDPSLPFCRLIWVAEIKGCCPFRCPVMRWR